MNLQELKKQLHQLIDDLNDEQSLRMLYEDAIDYKKADEDSDMSAEQWTALEEGMRQVENGEIVSQDALLEKFRNWKDKQ